MGKMYDRDRLPVKPCPLKYGLSLITLHSVHLYVIKNHNAMVLLSTVPPVSPFSFCLSCIQLCFLVYPIKKCKNVLEIFKKLYFQNAAHPLYCINIACVVEKTSPTLLHL